MSTYRWDTFTHAMNVLGFEPRDGQYQAVDTMLDATVTRGLIQLRAPTATGKSLAGLIACTEHNKATGERGILSTYTRLLQRQYQGDLDQARAIYPHTRYAVLKGAANYTCRNRAQAALPAAPNRLVQEALNNLIKGIIPVGEITEHDGAWARHAAADSELCRKCTPDVCGFRAARLVARDADVVVVNHALVFTNANYPSVLGPHGLLVIDEAHNMPAAAEKFGERTLSIERLATSRLDELVMDGTKAQIAVVANIKTMIAQIEQDLRDAARSPALKRYNRVESADLWPDDKLAADVDQLITYIQAMDQLADTGHHKTRLSTTLHEKAWPSLVAWSEAHKDGNDGKWPAGRVASVGFRSNPRDRTLPPTPLLRTRVADTRPIVRPALTSYVEDIWYDDKGEEHDNSFTRGVVLMSATTGCPAYPAYVAAKCGVEERATVTEVRSPLDYAAQMRVSLVQAHPLALASDTDGRTLILCRSWADVRAYTKDADAYGLRPFTQAENDPASTAAVVNAYRDKPRGSVLIGTRSFFEGLNIPGPALSQVVITNPPTPFGGRAEDVRRRKMGGHVKDGYLIPETALLLEQMIGRLIRSTDDVGLVAVSDVTGSRDWQSIAFPALTQALITLGTSLTPRPDALNWFRQHDPENVSTSPLLSERIYP